MGKIFKLNANLYRDVNAIHVFVQYDKREGGYLIKAEPLQYNFDGDLKGLYGKIFCPEYYNHNGDGIEKIIPCGRQSGKRLEEATEYCDANKRDIAEKYLTHILEKLNITKDIHIVKDV